MTTAGRSYSGFSLILSRTRSAFGLARNHCISSFPSFCFVIGIPCFRTTVHLYLAWNELRSVNEQQPAGFSYIPILLAYSTIHILLRLPAIVFQLHSCRGGWGKLAGGVKWPPPPVRYLTKVNEMAVVSGHLSSLEVTRGKISKSCPV